LRLVIGTMAQNNKAVSTPMDDAPILAAYVAVSGPQSRSSFIRPLPKKRPIHLKAARSRWSGLTLQSALGHFCLNAIDAITPRHALSSRQIGEVDVLTKRARLVGGNLHINPNVIFAYCHARGCRAVLNGYV